MNADIVVIPSVYTAYEIYYIKMVSWYQGLNHHSHCLGSLKVSMASLFSRHLGAIDLPNLWNESG
jgi:hypothetical protein